MSSDHVETFRSSLAGTATLHETAAGDATELLADIVEPPAVGISLPFEGIALPNGVETEFAPADLERAQTGVTAARHAVASYGTVMLATDTAGTELVSLYSSRHIAVVAASDLVTDMETAYARLDRDISADSGKSSAETQVLATGASVTADMGTLVTGVNGPTDVHIVLVTDR